MGKPFQFSGIVQVLERAVVLPNRTVQCIAMESDHQRGVPAVAENSVVRGGVDDVGMSASTQGVECRREKRPPWVVSAYPVAGYG